jgi:hypothetical protein
MEIVCPFCGHRTALMGDRSHPFVFEADYDFRFYSCPCGADAWSKEPLVALEVIPKDTEDIQREWFLGKKRTLCHAHVNYATHTQPPKLLFWLKKQIPPPDPSQKEDTS